MTGFVGRWGQVDAEKPHSCLKPCNRHGISIEDQKRNTTIASTATITITITITGTYNDAFVVTALLHHTHPGARITMTSSSAVRVWLQWTTRVYAGQWACTTTTSVNITKITIAATREQRGMLDLVANHLHEDARDHVHTHHT